MTSPTFAIGNVYEGRQRGRASRPLPASAREAGDPRRLPDPRADRVRRVAATSRRSSSASSRACASSTPAATGARSTIEWRSIGFDTSTSATSVCVLDGERRLRARSAGRRAVETAGTRARAAAARRRVAERGGARARRSRRDRGRRRARRRSPACGSASRRRARSRAATGVSDPSGLLARGARRRHRRTRRACP